MWLTVSFSVPPLDVDEDVSRSDRKTLGFGCGLTVKELNHLSFHLLSGKSCNQIYVTDFHLLTLMFNTKQGRHLFPVCGVQCCSGPHWLPLHGHIHQQYVILEQCEDETMTAWSFLMNYSFASLSLAQKRKYIYMFFTCLTVTVLLGNTVTCYMYYL